MLKRPQMLPKHNVARFQWNKQMLEKGSGFWRQVVFSDEKKFNLDGPDGLASYCHDVRGEEKVFSTRHQGRATLMLWGAISFYSTSHLVRINGNMESTLYCSVLEEDLIPFAAENLGEEWTFQQDRAS